MINSTLNTLVSCILVGMIVALLNERENQMSIPEFLIYSYSVTNLGHRSVVHRVATIQK